MILKYTILLEKYFINRTEMSTFKSLAKSDNQSLQS